MSTAQLGYQGRQGTFSTDFTGGSDSGQSHFFVRSIHLGNDLIHLRCHMIGSQPIQDVRLDRSIRLTFQGLGQCSIPSLIGNASRQTERIDPIIPIVVLQCGNQIRKSFLSIHRYHDIQSRSTYMRFVCILQQSLSRNNSRLGLTFCHQLLHQTEISRCCIAFFPCITHLLGSLAQDWKRQGSTTLSQRLIDGTSRWGICILQPSQQYRFCRSHLLDAGCMGQSNLRSSFLLHQIQQDFFSSVNRSQSTDGPFCQVFIIQIFHENRSIFRYSTISQ